MSERTTTTRIAQNAEPRENSFVIFDICRRLSSVGRVRERTHTQTHTISMFLETQLLFIFGLISHAHALHKSN